LFRPSRPDFIETLAGRPEHEARYHCSGHLGRTSLRQYCALAFLTRVQELFRPSRPDFIETI